MTDSPNLTTHRLELIPMAEIETTYHTDLKFFVTAISNLATVKESRIDVGAHATVALLIYLSEGELTRRKIALKMDRNPTIIYRAVELLEKWRILQRDVNNRYQVNTEFVQELAIKGRMGPVTKALLGRELAAKHLLETTPKDKLSPGDAILLLHIPTIWNAKLWGRTVDLDTPLPDTWESNFLEALRPLFILMALVGRGEIPLSFKLEPYCDDIYPNERDDNEYETLTDLWVLVNNLFSTTRFQNLFCMAWLLLQFINNKSEYLGMLPLEKSADEVLKIFREENWRIPAARKALIEMIEYFGAVGE